jgi:hypothetical protein
MTTMDPTVFLTDLVTGAVAGLTPDGSGWAVRQAGPTRLWDEIEAALDAWDSAEQPGPERFRMDVRPGRQEIRLPGNPALSFRLP